MAAASILAYNEFQNDTRPNIGNAQSLSLYNMFDFRRVPENTEGNQFRNTSFTFLATIMLQAHVFAFVFYLFSMGAGFVATCNTISFQMAALFTMLHGK